jgi:hypothetical protein
MLTYDPIYLERLFGSFLTHSITHARTVCTLVHLYSAGLQVDLLTKSKCVAMPSILLLIHYAYLRT